MEQSTLLGQPGDVGEVFLVMRDRLREILFFFRENLGPLLLVTFPFALAAALVVHLLGEPLVMAAKEQTQIHWPSALLLALLYPFALGVKVVAIHQLAGSGRLAAGALLDDALRLWPVMFGVSLLLGAAVFTGLLLFIVPAAWFYARLGYAPILVVTERMGVMAALAAAWDRSRTQQFELFMLTLLLGLVLATTLLLLFHLFGRFGVSTLLATDIVARGINELLFCLLTITFYRFWSVAARAS